MAKKVLWQELRRSEFEQAVKADAIVIIPVAATEQHGEHLPVNTDTSACFTIAQRAAQAIEEFPVLVLPVIWTGYSPHHMTYPGTITLKHHTFVELLTEVAVSVYTQGFRKILFLNGHGGNASVIDTMLRMKLAAEEGIPSSIGYTWWNIPPASKAIQEVTPGRGRIDHSGERETSIQLYLQPELVDKSAAVWTRGVLGDPSLGTREKGERIITAAIDGLAEILRDYHSGKLENSLSTHEGIFEGRKTI